MNFLNKNKKLFTMVCFLFCIGTLSAFFSLEKEKGIGEGIVLESIELNSFNNKYAQKKEDIVKKPYLLIEFFTLRCRHCKDNIKHLNELNKSDKLSVVGYINANSKKVRAYAKKYAVEFTLSRASKIYMKTFNPVAVPMSFLVDTKTLKVKKSFIGKVTEAEVLKEIEL
ncbi:MAG: hypothetical protein U9Q29_02080 [Campylobacterota bacterium]|nr:hypothetical protein [Campylobacterota bacterium]